MWHVCERAIGLLLSITPLRSLISWVVSINIWFVCACDVYISRKKTTVLQGDQCGKRATVNCLQLTINSYNYVFLDRKSVV